LRQLADLHGFRLIPVFSAGGSGPSVGRAGFVHQALGQDFASLRAYRIFVCGPPPMVDASKALALARGADPQHVLADAFYAEPVDATAIESNAVAEESAKPTAIWRRLRKVLR
jgi:NAD(P)H-flavin reductase